MAAEIAAVRRGKKTEQVSRETAMGCTRGLGTGSYQGIKLVEKGD